MKTTLLLFTVSLLLNASSCGKNGTTPSGSSITGTWKLVLMTGGIGSVQITADQWGHTRSYELHKDGTYMKREDGKPMNGKYTLGEETQRGTNEKTSIVTLDGEKFSYSFAHDTLVLGMYGISDPMYDWYVKQ
jgi:hypothetical protein